MDLYQPFRVAMRVVVISLLTCPSEGMCLNPWCKKHLEKFEGMELPPLRSSLCFQDMITDDFVDRVRFNSIPSGITFTQAASLELFATFGASTFQHIGLGAGSDATGSGGIYNGENPWTMFSIRNLTPVLRARTFTRGIYIAYSVPCSYKGWPHVYRIDWTASGFNNFIDWTLIDSEPTLISTPMRPAVSDYSNGVAVISVDWMWVAPYSPAGNFESRVFDAGELKTNEHLNRI
jgi:hypothetical protein